MECFLRGTVLQISWASEANAGVFGLGCNLRIRLTARGKSTHFLGSRFKPPAAFSDNLKSSFSHEATSAARRQAISA